MGTGDGQTGASASSPGLKLEQPPWPLEVSPHPLTILSLQIAVSTLAYPQLASRDVQHQIRTRVAHWLIESGTSSNPGPANPGTGRDRQGNSNPIST